MTSLTERPLTHLSLFSGIGGIDLAAEWAGFQTIAFCEIDPFCQKVLRKHWPNVPIIEDVKDVTYTKLMGWSHGSGESLQPEVKEAIGQNVGNLRAERPSLAYASSGYGWSSGRDSIHEGWTASEGGREGIQENAERGTGTTITDDQPASPNERSTITLVSGGFPCQPHSVAGKRKASSDERDLWPEFRRVIGEIKPRWVVAENVPGLFSSDSGRFFGNILRDLAALGYSVGWCCYGAVDVGALHRRDRVFIVCHAKHLRQPTTEITQSLTERGNGSATWQITTSQLEGPDKQWGIMADPSKPGLEGSEPEGRTSTRGLLAECGIVLHTPIEGLPDWAGGTMGQPDPLTGFERPDGTPKEREIERIFCRVFDGFPDRLHGYIGGINESRNFTQTGSESNQSNNMRDLRFNKECSETSSRHQQSLKCQDSLLQVPCEDSRQRLSDKDLCGMRKTISENGQSSTQDLQPGMSGDIGSESSDETMASYTVPVRNRVNRLRSLGNAVVPTQIYPVLKAIADIEHTYLLRAIEGER